MKRPAIYACDLCGMQGQAGEVVGICFLGDETVSAKPEGQDRHLCWKCVVNISRMHARIQSGEEKRP